MVPMPPVQISSMNIAVDIATSIVIVLASFVIFFITREFYQLSNHQGIKYFRYAFLFFGVTFLLQLGRIAHHAMTTVPWFRSYAIALLVYAGAMAMLCLVQSVLWKRTNRYLSHPFLLMTLLALLLTATTFIARIRGILLLLHLVLFVLVLVISYRDARKAKSHALKLHLLYLLLFVSWIARIAADFAMWRAPALGLFLDIVSAILFLVMMTKVILRTRARVV